MNLLLNDDELKLISDALDAYGNCYESYEEICDKLKCYIDSKREKEIYVERDYPEYPSIRVTKYTESNPLNDTLEAIKAKGKKV